MAGLITVSVASLAQQTFDANLYQGRPAEESSDATDTAKVRVFVPSERENTGRAIVICPGGGYEHLALAKEGYDWGEFFQNMGITAVVLKYRMPHGNPLVPVADAEQAMRLVRRNASAWGVSANDVGIMGLARVDILLPLLLPKAVATPMPISRFCSILLSPWWMDMVIRALTTTSWGLMPTRKRKNYTVAICRCPALHLVLSLF